jgi:hypothetical protein
MSRHGWYSVALFIAFKPCTTAAVAAERFVAHQEFSAVINKCVAYLSPITEC